MPGSDRDGVVDAARYLRRVRPVDPEEIYEYVEGRPHPAVVRRVLREEAPALGMVERTDGTFVPVPEGPVTPAFDGVDALPERYARRVEDLLVGRYGPDYHRGGSGDRIRETVRRLKADYYRGREVAYDEDVALAYAVYHLAGYYAVGQYVLDVLGREGLLGRHLRVLDVGAGVGGPALGLHDYLASAGDDARGVDGGPADGGPADDDQPADDPRIAPPGALVEYHAVEPSAAADVLDSLLGGTGPNFHATVHRTTAESFEPDGEFDLVLFGNVLSELAEPAAAVERYADALAPDGTLVAIAPADRNTSVQLREVERAVEDGLAVYAPTVRLWPGRRPTAECWSFDERPDLVAPAFQRRLAAESSGPDAFVNVSVRFSYSLLRPDGRRRLDLRADPGRFAPMADADSHVTDRVNLLAAKLSHDLADGGNPLFLVGDGSEATPHYAVLVQETALNEELRLAGYGDVLALEHALVLWNDDEGAYNVVVDERAVVDRVAAVDDRADGDPASDRAGG